MLMCNFFLQHFHFPQIFHIFWLYFQFFSLKIQFRLPSASFFKIYFPQTSASFTFIYFSYLFPSTFSLFIHHILLHSLFHLVIHTINSFSLLLHSLFYYVIHTINSSIFFLSPFIISPRYPYP